MTADVASVSSSMGGTSESELIASLQPYRYRWPIKPLDSEIGWRFDSESQYFSRAMPEAAAELAHDSRWPALFPAAICIITTTDGTRVAMEREVGASIVNRFPYVVAVSVCRESLSDRHYPRKSFMEILERGGVASLQFLPPGRDLDAALNVINALGDTECEQRIERSGLTTRIGVTNDAPAFSAAYMVYETTFAKPQVDFEGRTIYAKPWVDVGSHRIYFLEINAIQLREDIAAGREHIRWRALPKWLPRTVTSAAAKASPTGSTRYQKGYNPNYVFPAANTVAFEYDEVRSGMAIKYLPPLPKDQLEVDNDRARWPCFFPSSNGLITTWASDGVPNVMPCGSTTIVSRNPLIVAPCVSSAKINVRYAARKSLEFIRTNKRFGCGVPYINDGIVDAIKYAGNNSFLDDPLKVLNSGLSFLPSDYGPILREVPVHFDCEVIGELPLGTHIMFLGAVRRILVRGDVTPENPLEWCPWAGIEASR